MTAAYRPGESHPERVNLSETFVSLRPDGKKRLGRPCGLPGFSKDTLRLARLRFANAEELGAADRADALSRRLAILHRDRLGVLDFPLDSALHAICLH